jgi:hypothetical protein
MFGRTGHRIPGKAVGLVYFPARLLLRKLEGEGSNYFAGSGDLTALSQFKDQGRNTKK